MKRSTRIAIAIAVLLAIVVALGIFMKGRNKKGIEVTVAKVETMNLTSKVSANGQIEAKRKVDLSANVMGQIVNLAVREGDVVKKGDFLLQIDQTQLAASAAGAEASLQSLFSDRAAARAAAQERLREAERARRNYEQQIIPVAEYERSRTAVESANANVAAIEGRIAQARANLAGARDTLSKTTLRAPMAGIITRLPVEEGEVAVIGTMNNPGTVLLTISDMSVVEAVMEVDETDIPAVKVGQTATVTVDAYPNKTFNGVVTEVGSSPMNVAAAGTEAINFEVKIQLQNPPPDIRPGFSASAEITTAVRNNATAIPIQALVVREKPSADGAKGKSAAATSASKPVDEEGVYVFNEQEKKVKFQPVTTGIAGETSIEITSGVTPGAQIVTGPFRALREIKDGDKVRVAEEKKEGDEDEEEKDS